MSLLGDSTGGIRGISKQLGVGNWIDKQQASLKERGINTAKGVRIRPNSNAIRAMLKTQQAKKLLGKFSPGAEDHIDGLIHKTEEWLGTRVPSTLNKHPDILDHLNYYGGPIHGNRFIVDLHKPNGDSDTDWFFQYGANHIDELKHFKFVVQSASLPSTSISTNAVESPGPEVLMPYQIAYDDIALEVLCTVGQIDQDMHGLPEKRFFDAWMSSIIDPWSMEIGYRESYIIPEMRILVMGPHDLNTPVMIVTLKNCYPISMDAVELSHDNNELIKITVNIHFEKWTYENTSHKPLTVEPPQKFEARQEYDIKATRPDTTRTIYDGIESATNAASKYIPTKPNLGNIRTNTWAM